MANKLGFKYCTKCHILHLASTPQSGGCPAPAPASGPGEDCPAGGKHEDSPGEYAMRLGESGVGLKGGWQVCNTCKQVVFALHKGKTCAGNDHVFVDNTRYVVGTGDERLGLEAGWRCCRMCQSLYWLNAPVPGRCRSTGGDHWGAAGLHFALRFLPEKLEQKKDFHHYSKKDSIQCESRLTISNDGIGNCTLSWRIVDSGVADHNITLLWLVKDCWNVVYQALGRLSADGTTHGGGVPGQSIWSDNKGFQMPEFQDNWTDLAPPGASAECYVSNKVDAWGLFNQVISAGTGIAGTVLSVVK